MSLNKINSDTTIPDIESHFKISAGPGAGKTFWLVKHIKNVLHNSNKLFKTRKIACITYTNIAVEKILKRLGTSSQQVEVSTIHSFLYKHIVKPYVSFISDEYGLNTVEMDGHDEFNITFGKIKEWADGTSQAYLYQGNGLDARNKQAKIKDALENLQWILENNDLILKIDPKKPYLGRISSSLSIRYNSLIAFKKIYWEKGNIDHDDVLFFSYQIIKKHPFVLDILRAKFPYIYIDEFQDSNPIQVAIFKTIGNSITGIGVIGDTAQSIYGFQGADYSQFQTFSLPDIKEYILEENRRSSNEIIDVLNYSRRDLQQTKQRNITITKPIIYIGDMILALRAAKRICGSNEVYTLSRSNIISNAMKAEISGIGLNNKLLQELVEVDIPNSGNRYRSKIVSACIRSVCYAKEKRFKDSIKELEKLFNESDKTKRKRKALEFITKLLARYNEYENSTLFQFASFIRENLQLDLANFRAGSIKEFYDNHTFNQLALCVSIPEDISFHKTIHKSKGDEFDNVLLVLQKESDIKFLTESNLLSDEEHRINYVAISRAKNMLFISVPTLSELARTGLQTYFHIERV